MKLSLIQSTKLVFEDILFLLDSEPMGGEVSYKGLLVQMKNRLKQWSCGSGSV